MIDIKDIQGNILLSVPITQASERVEELMANDHIQLSWNSDSNEELQAGCYIDYNGERFSLLEPYKPTQKNEMEFTYTPQFKSKVMAWGKTPFFFYTTNEGQTTKEPDWTLTSNPADFMKCVCDALLNETGEQWTYVIDASLTASASLSFSTTDVLSGLNEIAGAFETEWYADKANNILYLGKASFGEPVTLEVGNNIQVPSVNNGKEGYYTRFYAFGSTRNIAQDYKGSNVNNLVNKRLTLDPVKYPNGYKDIREGLKDGEIFSKVLIFDEVYPSSKLSISGVRNRLMYRVDSDGKKIQIGTDESGNPIYDQYAIWYFRIDGFTFDMKSIIEGKTLSVNFQTGALSGREFELKYYEKNETITTSDGLMFEAKAGDYEILFIEESNYIIPSLTGLVPSDGDEIILFNIEMPSEYTQSAYDELEAELDKEIERLSSNLNNYTFNSNPVAFNENNPNLSVGRNVIYRNGSETLSTRVIKLTTKLDFPIEQNITIGNEKIKGNTQQLKEEVATANKDLNLMSVFNDMTQTLQQSYNRTQQMMLEGFASIKNIWQIKEDGNGVKYIFSEFNVATQGGYTQYADLGNLNIPSIYAGIPVDETTITKREDGTLMLNPNLELGGLDEEALQKYLDDYNYAKLTDVDNRINDLINGAPAAYDTLKEIADVLQGNVNSIGDIITTLGTKADKTELDKYIPIAGDTEVAGVKNFLSGLKVGGLPISKYEGYDDVIYIDANVVLRGGLTQYAVDPVTIPSIIDSLPIAGYEAKGVASFSSEFFAIDANGKVSIIPDSVGLNEEELEEWLANSDYATKTYADDRYFLASNFTKTNIAAKLGISDWALAATKPSYTTKEVTEDTNLYFTNQRAIDALADTLKAYVTLKGTQTIEGEKNFTGGLKVNGSPIVYDSENGYWLLQGNLLITGGLTQYVDDGSVDLPNLYDGLPIDGSTIYWDNGVLKAQGGGGGITSITKDMVVEALGYTPYDATNPNGYITSSALSSYQTKITSSAKLAASLVSGLATVATSGSYNDLSNKPTIPTNTNQLTNGAGYITSSALSSYQTKITSSAKLAASLVSGLATVATSGSYNDLSNKPTIPTNTNQLTNGAGYITSSALSSYLPLSGGTITNNSNSYPLHIVSSYGKETSIKFYRGSTVKGVVGYYDGNGTFLWNATAGSRLWLSDTDGLIFSPDLDVTKYNLIHSGNIGSQSVNYATSAGNADTLDGLHWDSFMRQFGYITSANTGNALLAGTFRFQETSGTGLPSGATAYGTMLTARGGHYDTLWQLYGNYNNYGLFYRRGNLTGIVSNAWKQIAFTDSNVASATKLQTARTIWGQSFDGTSNVNGVFRSIGDYGTSEKVVHSILSYKSAPYGLITSIAPNGNVSLQARREANTSEVLTLLLNPLGGNVGIGITSPAMPLHVYAATNQIVRVESSSSKEASIIYVNNAANVWVAGVGPSIGGNTFGIWSGTYGLTMHIDASANMLVRGGITQYSDIRKKTKLQDVELTLKQVANAPLIEHYYNSDDKKTTHVGSIAQYWAEMNDWFCKLGSDGYYTMEIQNAALASAISVARELERYESKTDKKIRMLKKRINELEDEIEILKKGA